MIRAKFGLFSTGCPHCRSIDFRSGNTRNAIGTAFQWLLQPYWCSLCGHRFFLFRWQIPVAARCKAQRTGGRAVRHQQRPLCSVKPLSPTPPWPRTVCPPVRLSAVKIIAALDQLPLELVPNRRLANSRERPLLNPARLVSRRRTVYHDRRYGG